MINGLYAVTTDLADSELLAKKVELALQGGASIVQYRNKRADPELRRGQAHLLRDLCRRYSVPLIINDDAELAKAIGAEGVHLGSGDGDIRSAREILGAKKIIGASCYNQIQIAEQRLRKGADYVAFGSFFPSSNKTGAVRADPGLLRQATETLRAPIVAIGGITLDNAREIIVGGADAIAVISALFDAEDIRATAQCFSSLFERHALARPF